MLSQRKHPEKQFEITNLLASCQTAETCDQRKKSHDLPAALDPYQTPNLQDIIVCDSLGTLDFSGLPPAAARFAETHLNLNSPALKSQRAGIIAGIQSMTVALGTNARKRLRSLPPPTVGFRSLYYQQLKHLGQTLGGGSLANLPISNKK
jgi:hypothetical protein